MFDNGLKPAFHPKRLNTKKGNFQKYITFCYSYDRRFAIIQGTKRFSKHPFQYKQWKLIIFWQKYDLKKSISERKPFSVEQILKALYIKHLIKLVF